MDETYARDRQYKPAVSFRYKIRALTTFRALRRHLDPQSPLRVLDLGAADGATLLEIGRLLPAGSTLTGVEYSPVLVALAARLAPAVEVLRGDISSLPETIKHESFDLVIALAVLEHLAQPVAAILEAARVLTPGGLFIASTPHPFWDVLATRLRMLEDHHETHLGRAEMLGFARQAGLEVLEYRRFMWGPVGFLPYLHIGVPAPLACAADQAIQVIPLLNSLFVNQMLVARKPDPRL